MAILKQLTGKYKRVAIVGMAKNAGKTTTLNYLIEEAMDEGMVIGVTSTGRDGENTDLVTGTDKPKVYLDAGTIVSVPVQLYELSEAGLEILSMTRYSTALGQLMLCRVADSGYVQIAGPVNTADHKSMCNDMIRLGAEIVLIDGAVDRRSIAAPGTSDAIILATGAVLSRSLKKTVEETLHVLNLYRLPLVENEEIRGKILEGGTGERIRLIKKDRAEDLDLATSLMAGKVLDEAIDQDTEWVYIPGALTESVISDIHPAKLRKLTFVLKDPTKIFIGATPWQQMCKRGFRVEVLENIKVAAVTVNPYAPAGYSFDHRDLLKAMESATEGIPVIDVRYGAVGTSC
ncbi:hypothetical protein MASR2M70_06670 [Bacillota bacterium]